MYVNKQSVNNARTADLYEFLRENHSGEFRQCGSSIYMKANRSLYVKSGFSGYRDFATGETGNGIDLLTGYLGYSFQEAVTVLCGHKAFSIASAPPAEAGRTNGTISLPEPAPFPHKRMFAYLMKRSIPKDAIRYLASGGLIYQEKDTGNIVFINREKDYCELRGTFTYTEKPFHGCRKAKSDRFWYFRPEGRRPEVAFVTESAIDAISLWILLQHEMITSSHMYISIGGVSNYSTIDRITRNIKTVIAVDNDYAGDICRSRYKNLESIIPSGKDWNEDLQARSSSGFNIKPCNN